MGRYAARGSVGFVCCIYAAEWLVYHVWCKPWWLYAIAFNATLGMAVWSYLQTALTDPGTMACPEWTDWSATRTREQEAASRKLAEHEQATEGRRAARWRPGEVSWCRVCCAERPERAHHCSQCGVCVLRMDHHCPWLGNCVGWRNHKYFILMTFWSFWASLTFLVTLRGPTAMEAMALGTYTESPSMVPTIGVLGAFVFLLVTGGMSICAIYMAARNITIVEELIDGDNPYRYPELCDNLRQLLGSLDTSVFVPLSPKGRLAGTSFPAWPESEYCSSSAAPNYGTA